MSSDSAHRKRLKKLSAVILVVIVATGLGAGWYFASAAKGNDPLANWTVDPLRFTFSQSQGSGSGTDAFTCTPSVSPVTLDVFSAEPRIITFTVKPSSFPSCGTTPNGVVVTAACTPVGISQDQCGGQNQFYGTITVCGPTPYQCFDKSLIVVVTVTGNSNSQG